ncbi:hypothetical protein [Mesorhizobium sp.]|uniref:hypothetical protein n=1 Tax=Mesorhizobium sp. TaxID=1871066 RepID=UPI0025F4E235|nr:hypothetical protein [Mesorhizobium sp.]
MNKEKAVKYLADSMVAIATALEAVTEGDAAKTERAIKSAYFGLDNALTVARRELEVTR